jgi:hypothetical protein
MYHREGLVTEPNLQQRTALPRPIAKGSFSRPLLSFQLTEQSFQNFINSHVRIDRVAKRIAETYIKGQWSFVGALVQVITRLAKPFTQLTTRLNIYWELRGSQKRATQNSNFITSFIRVLNNSVS